MPAPHRKVVNIDPQADSVGPASDEPFTYTTPGGVEFSVASLAKPFKTSGELRKMRNTSPLNLAYYILERDLTVDQLTGVDEMTMDEFDTFSREWAEHSGMSLGN